jgi:hypothetical protein
MPTARDNPVDREPIANSKETLAGRTKAALTVDATEAFMR